jgi:hypothetical protein
MSTSEPAAFQQVFASALAGDALAAALFADPAIARALAVHRNTSAKAAQDALAVNYPVVRALVGEESFTAFAEVFVARRPPQDPRLCLYGEGLGDVIADYAPFAEAPYLADVAALERLVTEALFAADAEPLDGAGFARALDCDAPLVLHPAARFAAAASPAVSIWRAHRPDAPPGALEALAWDEEAMLVTRPGMSVEVAVIDGGAFAFLKACQAGATVAQAALAVAELDADVSAVVATLITAGAFRARLD